MIEGDATLWSFQAFKNTVLFHVSDTLLWFNLSRQLSAAQPLTRFDYSANFDVKFTLSCHCWQSVGRNKSIWMSRVNILDENMNLLEILFVSVTYFFLIKSNKKPYPNKNKKTTESNPAFNIKNARAFLFEIIL